MTCTCGGFAARWVSIASSSNTFAYTNPWFQYVPGVRQMLCGTLDCDVKQTTTIPAGSDYYIEKEATWNVNACDHGRWRNAYTPSFADASAGAGRGRNVHTNTVPGPNHPTVLASRFTFTSLVAWLHQFSNLTLFRSWKVKIFLIVALSFVVNKYCSIIG
jgi:hypothetical protein